MQRTIARKTLPVVLLVVGLLAAARDARAEDAACSEALANQMRAGAKKDEQAAATALAQAAAGSENASALDAAAGALRKKAAAETDAQKKGAAMAQAFEKEQGASRARAQASSHLSAGERAKERAAIARAYAVVCTEMLAIEASGVKMGETAAGLDTEARKLRAAANEPANAPRKDALLALSAEDERAAATLRAQAVAARTRGFKLAAGLGSISEARDVRAAD